MFSKFNKKKDKQDVDEHILQSKAETEVPTTSVKLSTVELVSKELSETFDANVDKDRISLIHELLERTHDAIVLNLKYEKQSKRGGLKL